VGKLFIMVLGLLVLCAVVAMIVAAFRRRSGSDDIPDSAVKLDPVDVNQPPPKPSNRFLMWLDDHMNPIAVKELRQAVRARFITGMLMLLLGVQVLVIMVFVMYDDDVTEQGGGRVFFTLSSVLSVISLLTLPAYAGARLTWERMGQSVDLMHITSLRPRTIVLGKFFSVGVVALMMFSTCLPFISFSYLLRGIDLPTIFLCMAWSFVLTLGMISVGVFLGAIRGGVFLKAVLGIGLMVSIIPVAMSASGFLIQEIIGIADFSWGVAGTAIALLAAATGLFLSLAAAAISPPVMNRALPVRAYITIAAAVTGAIMYAWARESGHCSFMVAWAFFMTLVLCLAMMVSVCERDSLPMRIRQGIPRMLLPRAAAFVFFSGSGGGMLWCLLMAGGVLMALLASMWSVIRPPYMYYSDDIAMAYVLSMGHVFAAAVLGGTFVRMVSAGRFRSSSWVAGLIILALQCVIPLVIYGVDIDDWGPLKVISPISLFEDSSFSKEYRLFVLGYAGFAFVVGAFQGIWQLLRFKPPAPPAKAPQDVEAVHA
jgi:hypothetical protein